MKRQLITIIFLLQFLNSSILAQKTEVIVVFNNGDSLSGYGSITGDYLKFKINKKSKPIKYHFSKLKYTNLLSKNRIQTYKYIQIKSENDFRVLEEILTGKVNLYIDKKNGYNYNITSNSGYMGGQPYSINRYYLKRKNENQVTPIGSDELFSKNFNKSVLNFFSDCSFLINKINNKEFKKKDIVEMVNYYNLNCKLN